MKKEIRENYDKIFNHFFTLMTERLDIGYGLGIGFCALVDKQKSTEEVYKISGNHVRCLLRLCITNGDDTPEYLQNLSKQELNKLLTIFVEKMEEATQKTFATGTYTEVFREIDGNKIKKL